MKPAFVILYILCVTSASLAQTNPAKPMYTKLDTFRREIMYSGVYSSGPSGYSFNGRPITKREYDHFMKMNEANDISHCRPCYLFTYEEGILIRESEQFTDCAIGLWKEYYPNGQVREFGQYKRNLSGIWTKVYPDYCSVKQGEWLYFSQAGDTLYREYWANDSFIRQVPEQDRTEIWKVAIMLDGRELSINDSITAEQIRRVEIKPLFKNRSTAGVNLTYEFRVSASMKIVSTVVGKSDEMGKVDLFELLQKSEIRKEEEFATALTIYNNSIPVRYFPILVRF